jgi:hypothetical protein
MTISDNTARIYSLNKIAFLATQGVIDLSKASTATIEKDGFELEMNEDNTVKFLIEKTDKLKQAIDNYRKNQDLHNFINSYMKVVDVIRAKKYK